MRRGSRCSSICLTIIVGYSTLIKQQVSVGDSLFRNAVEIDKAADRANDLARQLLSLSWKRIEVTLLDLNRLLSEMDAVLHPAVGANVELVALLEPGLGLVKADAGRKEQMIADLVRQRASRKALRWHEGVQERFERP